MQVFVMSLIGMIFIILSPVWSYWTAMGGLLMAVLGGIFILIAKNVDDEKYNKEEKIRLMKLERQKKIKELREAATREEAAQQHVPEQAIEEKVVPPPSPADIVG